MDRTKPRRDRKHNKSVYALFPVLCSLYAQCGTHQGRKEGGVGKEEGLHSGGREGGRGKESYVQTQKGPDMWWKKRGVLKYTSFE